MMTIANQHRRWSIPARIACVLAVALCKLSPCWAAGTYEVDNGPSPISLRVLADFRIVPTDTALSWTYRGPGKLRYGGHETDSGRGEATVRFALSQLAVELGVDLPWELAFHTQLNWEVDVDDQGDFDHDDWPRLVEGYLRREWGKWDRGFGVQAGVMNAPFSLEQSGPAWTSPYSLTPSAVSTWLWEEPRIVGLEGETWRGLGEVARLGLVGGFGWGEDELGWLLAERGFVLSDFLSGVNTELPVPTKGRESSVFKERDGRPAIYVAVSLRDTNEIGELRIGYLDNLADQSADGNWETRFGTAGVLLHPWSKLDFGFQSLFGEIDTKVNRWDSHFYAWYPLVSLHHRGHRLSARYDNFDVDDDEHAAPFSGDHGQAVTVAYLYEFRLRHRVGVEYAHVDSEHPARTADRDRTDDLFQVSYRFRY